MNQSASSVFITFEDDGIFPNNKGVPLIVYPGVFGEHPDPDRIETLLNTNGWPPAWRYTVYPYHHYHSRAHEFLGCFRGSARILFGGDRGREVEIRPGDGVMIPAGVAHNCLEDKGLTVVGAYPEGQSPDMRYGRPGERPEVDRNILALGRPPSDPVTGQAFTAGKSSG